MNDPNGEDRVNMQKSGTLLAAAVAAAIAGNASAQDAPTTGGLDEVTVMAQRREQSLQDVPIAISAFSTEQLTTRNIVDTYDLVRNVPNLTGNANVGVGTSSSLYIRGIGNAESIATFDVPVGTYVDDVYISRQNQNNFGMFDVERIEVLRGPQGTLFGHRAAGLRRSRRRPVRPQAGARLGRRTDLRPLPDQVLRLQGRGQRLRHPALHRHRLQRP
jgi:outer membrane receptor protein involved in Fe transport